MTSGQLKRYSAAAFRPPNALDTIVTLFSPTESGPGGDFFAVFVAEEIPTLVPWLEDVAHLALDTYRQASADGADGERAVGLARQKIKRKLQQLQNETRSQAVLHLLIGCLSGQQVTLTHSGEVSAYLLHRFSASDTSRYRWVNITETPTTEVKKKKTGKTDVPTLAATVITGTIGESDTVVICTNTLTDAMSLDWIEKLATQIPREAVGETLEDQLPPTSRHSYGVIMLIPQTESTPLATPKAIQSPPAPLPTKRDDLWRPPEVPTTTPRSVISHPVQQMIDRVTVPRPAAAPARAAPSLARRRPPVRQQSWAWQIGKTTGQTGRLLAALGRGLLFLPITLPRAIMSAMRGEQRLHPQARGFVLAEQTRERLMETMASNLGRMPVKSRRLLAISLVCGYLFLQSLVFLASRQTQQVTENALTTQLSTIQQQLDQVDAALTFGNDEQAAATLTMVEAAIAQLPRTSRQDQARRQTLEQTATSLRQRLERRMVVTDISLVANLPPIGNNSASPDGLWLAGNTLITYRSDDHSFTKTTPSKNTATGLTPTGATPHGRLIAATPDDKGGLSLASDGSALFSLDPATTTLVEQTLSEKPQGIADLDFYRGRLYILDPSAKQIWRYDPAADGFGARRTWLTSTLPQHAVSMRIAEGALFILTTNGAISKLVNGQPEQWQAKVTATGPQHYTKLLIPAGSKHLYAIDLTAKHLTMFDLATGRLLQTLDLASTTDLKDIAVDEAAGMGYALDGVSVKKFALPK